jgi:hypothetical protein
MKKVETRNTVLTTGIDGSTREEPRKHVNPWRTKARWSIRYYRQHLRGVALLSGHVLLSSLKSSPTRDSPWLTLPCFTQWGALLKTPPIHTPKSPLNSPILPVQLLNSQELPSATRRRTSGPHMALLSNNIRDLARVPRTMPHRKLPWGPVTQTWRAWLPR